MKVIYSIESEKFLYSCPAEEKLELWISEIELIIGEPLNPIRSK